MTSSSSDRRVLALGLALAGCGNLDPYVRTWEGACTGGALDVEITLSNGIDDQGYISTATGEHEIYRVDVLAEPTEGETYDGSASLIRCVDEAGCTFPTQGEVGPDYVEVSVPRDVRTFILIGTVDEDDREMTGDCFWAGPDEAARQGVFTLTR